MRGTHDRPDFLDWVAYWSGFVTGVLVAAGIGSAEYYASQTELYQNFEASDAPSILKAAVVSVAFAAPVFIGGVVWDKVANKISPGSIPRISPFGRY